MLHQSLHGAQHVHTGGFILYWTICPNVGGRFPRVFGDEIGEEFGENLVMILVNR